MGFFEWSVIVFGLMIINYLSDIASSSKDAVLALKVNTPETVKPKPEDLSDRELCRRFRIRLEEAQNRKSRR
ncbi:MAG: hypothetical protein SGJ27_06660 [Candidatus Melainabacteria bacterium]|nr:hypothetical protein [Candidatus Melainabacteria bacterium]